jgi:two-component system alkaline phosphatase synthesis response regulator PhoP
MAEKKTVLVVEDDHFLSDIYKRQLESKGCKVQVASNGTEALKTLKTLKPDVLLLDLIMPGMNGFEFLEALRGDTGHKKTRVIVLSNLGQESDKERCRALGVKEYLVKTEVSVDQILTAVLS